MRIFIVTFLLIRAISAQWLVYDFKVTHARGINFEPFPEGFLILPIDGGSASMVFINKNEYYVRADSGRFYLSKEGATKAYVFSSLVNNDSAEVAYLVYGEPNEHLTLDIASKTYRLKIAEKMHGAVVASDETVDKKDIPEEGNLGLVGIATMHANYNKTLTRLANRKIRTIEEQLLAISDLLNSRGLKNAE